MAVIPTNRPRLKTAFKKTRTISPLYTSGAVAITQDGKRLVTCVAADILLTDVGNGLEICRFVGDSQPIHSLCITPSSSHLIVFTASFALRIYELPNTSIPLGQRVQPIRVVHRAHDGPVHTCVVDPTSTYLASGSADGVVKVWNILGGFVTHVFKGHGGVVSALLFRYPQDPSTVTRNETMHLISASVDTRIRIFNLTEGSATSSGGGKPEVVLEGHVSVPRGLDVSYDGRWLISGGRDSVVLIWDLHSESASAPPRRKKKSDAKQVLTPKLFKTIPVLERVEAVGILLSQDNEESTLETLKFYTGGEKGIVRVWNAKSATVTQQLGKKLQGTPGEDIEEQRQIMNILYVPFTSTLISIHADQNIIFYSLAEGRVSRQLIGYNDEVVDATFLHYKNTPNPHPRRDSHIALATNSSLVRVYSMQDLDSRLLEGHSEIVLAIDHSANGTLLASGSKDKTARIWAPIASENGSSQAWGYTCVGVCEGHAESVGAVAMAREGDAPTFMFTGSQDRTIKMWDIAAVPSTSSENTLPKTLKTLTTQVAHDKDINSLDISPNDKFLVSGSQDRTAKVFEIQYIVGAAGVRRGELKHIGTCKGHKRGVWTVRFGKGERVLATGSGDMTVKLWNLDDYSCLKTFEGHSNSVLRVDFLNAGIQLVSTASDGLVKLWNIREEECITTLDNHEDKVWALAISADERTIVSGAADSVVTFWEDCTEEVEAEKEATRAELALRDQDFLNYVALHDYRRAIELALSMSQPGRLFSLFKDVASENQPASLTGNASVDEVIHTLAASDLVKLLAYVRDWNTNAKTSSVAQGVLFAIVKLHTADDIMRAFGDGHVVHDLTNGETKASRDKQGSREALKELAEALIPYSQRHLSRTSKLLQESYVLDYILGEMDDGLFDGDLDSSDNMQVD